MAEVVGTASAIITLLDAAVKISRLIRDIRYYPDELAAISNEVSDLRLLVCQVDSLALEDLTLDTYLTSPVRSANKRLKSVEAFLQNIIKRPKLAWARWALDKLEAQKLQADLRDARQQIDAALSLASMYAKTYLNKQASD